VPIVITIKKEHGSFDWKKEDEKGLKLLKEKITKQPILIFQDFRKNSQVKCDASGVAISAVLSQDDNPVSFFNENLNDSKRKYPNCDEEF